MARSMEGSGGGRAERENSHERTEEEKRKIGKRLLELLATRDLDFEEQMRIIDILEDTYDALNKDPDGGVIVENNPDDNNPTENNPGEGGPAENNPAENNPGEGGPAENNPGEGEPAENNPDEDNPAENNPDDGGTDEDNPAENHEAQQDYEAMTLAKAEASGDSGINIDDVEDALRAKHPDMADEAISMLALWERMSHEERLDVLRGNANNRHKGLGNVLERVGLIEISSSEADDDSDEDNPTETTPAEDDTSENDPTNDGPENDTPTDDTPEDEPTNNDPDNETPEDDNSTEDDPANDTENTGEEDEARRNRAEAFVNDPQKKFWLEHKEPPINPEDLVNNADEYTTEKLDELDGNYETDRVNLSNELMEDDAFAEWYRALAEGNNENDLADMGYKDLYELKQRFEGRSAEGENLDDGSPLVAAGLTSEAEIQRRARQIASEQIENENKHAKGLWNKFLTAVWRSSAGKEHLIRKRQDEIVDLIKERNKLLTKRDTESGLTDAEKARLTELDGMVGEGTWDGCEGDVSRFVEAHTRGIEGMIRGDRGEWKKAYSVEYDENGNAIVKNEQGEVVDQESNPEAKRAAEIESSIREYAKAIGDIYQGRMLDDEGNPITDPEELARLEENELIEFRRKMAELRLNGPEGDTAYINNYEQLAIRAGQRAKHEMGIDNIMRGFQYISGNIYRERSGEVNRNKAQEFLATKIGSLPFVPETVAVISAGVIMGLMPKAASSTGRFAGGLLGGSIMGGVAAGIERYQKLTDQYNTAANALAAGGELEFTNPRSLEATMTKNIMELMTDKETGERITAEYLSGKINAAMEAYNAALENYNGDSSDVNRRTSLAEATSTLRNLVEGSKGRLQMSDEHNVNLVGFSSDNLSQMEKERTNLWITIANAEAALDKAHGIDGVDADIEAALTKAREGLSEQIRANRADIRNDKLGRAALYGLARTGINFVSAVALDELFAFWDPNRLNVAENKGWVNTQNNEGASNTFLSGTLDKLGFTGFKGERLMRSDVFETEAEARAAMQQGDTIREVPNGTETETIWKSDADIATDYDHIVNRHWYGNGTAVSEGNELRLYGEPGHWSIGMEGVSTDGMGSAINVGELQQQDGLTLLVSLSRETQSNPIPIPIVNGHADISSLNLSPDLISRIEAGDIWTAEVAQMAPGATNVFATYPYLSGGGGAMVEEVTEKTGFVIEGLRDVERATTFDPRSLLGFFIPHTGRSIGIRRGERPAPGVEPDPVGPGGTGYGGYGGSREGEGNQEGDGQEGDGQEREPVTEGTETPTEQTPAEETPAETTPGAGAEQNPRTREELVQEFTDNEQMVSWLRHKESPIDPNDIVNNPEEYTAERLNEMAAEYEADRIALGGRLIENDEFANWYRGLVEGNDETDLVDMGYDELYQLERRYNEERSGAETGGDDARLNEAVEAFSRDPQKMFYFNQLWPNSELTRGSYLPAEGGAGGIEAMDALNRSYEQACRDLSDELMEDDDFAEWYRSLAEGNNENDLAGLGYKDLFELSRQFEQREETPSFEPITVDMVENSNRTQATQAMRTLWANYESIANTVPPEDADDLREAARLFARTNNPGNAIQIFRSDRNASRRNILKKYKLIDF